MNRTHLLKFKREENVQELPVAKNGAFFFRERELLSRIVGDLTVDNRRDEKESCFTRKGLRVGTGFKEFRQTP